MEWDLSRAPDLCLSSTAELKAARTAIVDFIVGYEILVVFIVVE
jgi:hypothetical protein